MTQVGFVGAGRMGAPMVRRLVEAGHEVRALGRTTRSAAVSELGAQPVTDAGRVAEGADVVVVCVFTDEQVRQVCLESDLVAAMRPARSWSCTPPEARAPPRRSRGAAASTSSTHRSAAVRTTSPPAG